MPLDMIAPPDRDTTRRLPRRSSLRGLWLSMRTRLSLLGISLPTVLLVGLELRTSYQAEVAAATREAVDLALLLEAKIDTQYGAASEIATIMA